MTVIDDICKLNGTTAFHNIINAIECIHSSIHHLATNNYDDTNYNSLYNEFYELLKSYGIEAERYVDWMDFDDIYDTYQIYLKIEN